MVSTGVMPRRDDAHARAGGRALGLGLAVALACGLDPASPPTPIAPSSPSAPDPSPQPAPDEADADALVVGWRHLANEGFALSLVGRVDRPPTQILIDAVVGTGLPEYPAPDPATRAQIERGEPPFDHVALVLATHHHDDHFDPAAMLRLLAANPGAQLITTPRALARMREVDAATFAALEPRARGLLPPEDAPIDLEVSPAIGVRAFNLHHGQGRKPLVEHLGFLLRLGDRHILHLGDTELDVRELAALPLADEGPRIDVVFVPYWHLLDDAWTRTLRARAPRASLVAMHLPRPDAPASVFRPFGSHAALVAAVTGRCDRIAGIEPGIAVVLLPTVASP